MDVQQQETQPVSPTELVAYIWRNDDTWQYGDGISMQGGAETCKEAWEQLHYYVLIKRQKGFNVGSIRIVFSEPAPASEQK